MARGNLIQGQASGKLGDTVLMVRNGQQLARVYTTSGARSGEAASESARIQRVKFGAASNEWNLYRYVSTRMFRKGRTKNQSDYNYWVKRNNQLLPYLTKTENSLGCKYMMPGVLSEGSLGNLSEILSYTEGTGDNPDEMVLAVLGSQFNDEPSWSSTVEELKEQLRIVFPNATKVVYLVAYADVATLEADEREYFSQNVSYYPVTFDLFNDATGLDATLTIKQYFTRFASATPLAAIWAAQDSDFAGGNAPFKVLASTTQTRGFLSNMSVIVFATNDSVSDCYTTTLSSQSVNPLSGVYSLWSEHRSSEALSRAASSYGYQSGVMRDEVSSVGIEVTQAVANYAERLAEFSPERAKAFLKSAEKKLAEAAASPAAGAGSEK